MARDTYQGRLLGNPDVRPGAVNHTYPHLKQAFVVHEHICKGVTALVLVSPTLPWEPQRVISWYASHTNGHEYARAWPLHRCYEWRRATPWELVAVLADFQRVVGQEMPDDERDEHGDGTIIDADEGLSY